MEPHVPSPSTAAITLPASMEHTARSRSENDLAIEHATSARKKSANPTGWLSGARHRRSVFTMNRRLGAYHIFAGRNSAARHPTYSVTGMTFARSSSIPDVAYFRKSARDPTNIAVSQNAILKTSRCPMCILASSSSNTTSGCGSSRMRDHTHRLHPHSHTESSAMNGAW